MPAPPGRPAGLACRHPQQPPAGRRTPPADRPRRGGRPGGAGDPALGRSPDRPGHLELPAGAAGRVGSRRPGRGAAVHGAAATAVRAVAADPVTRPVGPAATEPSRLRPGSWSRALAARRRSGHAAGKVSLGHLPGAAAGLVRCSRCSGRPAATRCGLSVGSSPWPPLPRPSTCGRWTGSACTYGCGSSPTPAPPGCTCSACPSRKPYSSCSPLCWSSAGCCSGPTRSPWPDSGPGSRGASTPAQSPCPQKRARAAPAP